jgi:hypothetical protein
VASREEKESRQDAGIEKRTFAGRRTTIVTYVEFGGKNHGYFGWDDLHAIREDAVPGELGAPGIQSRQDQEENPHPYKAKGAAPGSRTVMARGGGIKASATWRNAERKTGRGDRKDQVQTASLGYAGISVLVVYFGRSGSTIK